MQQKNQPGNMSAQNNSPKTWLIFSARLPVKSSTKLLRVVWRWTTSCWRCLCRRGDACAVFPRAHSASEILRKTPKLNGKVNATRYRKSLFFGLCSHSRVLKYSVQVSWMDYQFLPFLVSKRSHLSVLFWSDSSSEQQQRNCNECCYQITFQFWIRHHVAS